jgi:hypothetical protein
MRVLIISPHFPPCNAADMHRVRLVLPYLKDLGIQAEVLAVEAEQVVTPMDQWLAAGLPDGVPVHRVKAWSLKWARIPGLGLLNTRALSVLRKKGDSLLCKGNFDLVYFSTTVFGIHVLGPEWLQKFGVPFVMDYQDPWVSDYYREHPEVRPPGGRLKYAVADWLSRRSEPRVLSHCRGITSVSPAYPEQLSRRYPWLKILPSGSATASVGFSGTAFRQYSLHSLVIPFPGDSRDFERVRQETVCQSVFDPADGLKHWVYVGRGGLDMRFALRALFHALSQLREAGGGDFLQHLRMHFIGTSYAASGLGQKTIEPVAAEFGLEQQVFEHTDRIPYSETLRCLLDADALIIPGSDDPAYTASKMYPYLLAARPLLAIFHETSSVVNLIRKAGGGSIVAFHPQESLAGVSQRLVEILSLASGEIPHIVLDPVAFEPHTARLQASELANFWKQCLIQD